MTSPYSTADLNAISTEITMLTPEVAEMLRTTCLFERQRPVCAVNVDRIACEILRGTFVRGTPLLIAVLPDRSKRLLNGVQICEAVMKTALAIPVVLITLRVRNLEEAAAIYSVIDRQKTRKMIRVGAPGSRK